MEETSICTHTRPRHIVIVGGGLAGVTAAYALARRSAKVKGEEPCKITLVERRSDLALETSFANAGRHCPTSVIGGSPAQTSTMFRNLLPSWLRTAFPLESFDPDSPVPHNMEIKLTLNTAYWGILALWSKASRYRAERIRKGHELLMKRAARAFEDLKQQTLIGGAGSCAVEEKIETHPGLICLFRDTERFKAAAQTMRKKLSDSPVCEKITEYNFADFITSHTDKHRGAEYAAEQGFLSNFPFLTGWKKNGVQGGCLHYGADSSSDARIFTKLVAEAALQNPYCPVDILFGETVTAIECVEPNISSKSPEARRVVGVRLDEKLLPADTVILACGPSLSLAPSGWWCSPIAPLRGFSVDLFGCELGGSAKFLPNCAIADYSSGDLNFQMTPFRGGRIRLVGYADFVGYDRGDEGVKFRHGEALKRYAKYVLPDLSWKSARGTWSGLRPMTPDNLPYVGEDQGCEGVFLCCGHGATGWTTSPGTAELLADIVFPGSVDESLVDDSVFLCESLSPARFDNWFVRTLMKLVG